MSNPYTRGRGPDTVLELGQGQGQGQGQGRAALPKMIEVKPSPSTWVAVQTEESSLRAGEEP